MPGLEGRVGETHVAEEFCDSDDHHHHCHEAESVGREQTRQYRDRQQLKGELRELSETGCPRDMVREESARASVGASTSGCSAVTGSPTHERIPRLARTLRRTRVPRNSVRVARGWRIAHRADPNPRVRATERLTIHVPSMRPTRR